MKHDILEAILRFLKPSLRSWLVKTLTVAGVGLLSSPWYVPLLERALELQFEITLKYVFPIGLCLVIAAIGVYLFGETDKPSRLPRFDINPDNLRILLGSGASCVFEEPSFNRPFIPFTIGQFSPIKVYAKKNCVEFDADLVGVDGTSILQIRRNKIKRLPNGWDWNSNDQILEIVDQHLAPVFQAVFKNDSEVLINGTFHNELTILVADSNGVRINPELDKLGLEDTVIFQYPSWKHRGVTAT